MDYTIHGILQARILDWVAFPFSRGPSQRRDWTGVSCFTGRFFTSWASRGALIWVEAAYYSGLPWWLSRRSICLQCRRRRRHGFNPWVRKSPWKRKWPSIPVFLLEKPHGQGNLQATVHRAVKSQTQLSDSLSLTHTHTHFISPVVLVENIVKTQLKDIYK